MSKKAPIILAALLAFGCGNQVADKDRPSNNGSANNGDNNGGSSTNNSTVANNGVTNANNGQTTANNGQTNANNGQTNANNGQTNNGTTPNCVWDDQFFGQIGGIDEHAGGIPTPVGLTNDAGLNAVYAAVPLTTDDPATIPDEGYLVLDNPIYVGGAIVTSTAGGVTGNRRFWLEDRNNAIQVFAQFDVGQVKVGDSLSFYVNAVQNFEGHPQIAEISDVSFDSGDNPVPYRDINNRTLQQSDYGHIVRLAGRLGTPYDCGGTSCFDFTYPGGTATFRSKSMFATAGSCAQWTGPAYSFPGPLNPDGTTPLMQIDTINYDWVYFE